MPNGVNVPLTFEIFKQDPVKGDTLVRTETLTQDIIKIGKLPPRPVAAPQAPPSAFGGQAQAPAPFPPPPVAAPPPPFGAPAQSFAPPPRPAAPPPANYNYGPPPGFDPSAVEVQDGSRAIEV